MNNQPVKFDTYEEFQEWFPTICPLDEFGFHKKMKVETIPEEIERIELNLAYYKEFMKNHSRFPRWVHDQRSVEFHRLRELVKPIEYGLNDAQLSRLRE